MGISLGTGIPKISARREIPVWEISGREKFETIREGGNGNFPLNIPGASRAIYKQSYSPLSLFPSNASHSKYDSA